MKYTIQNIYNSFLSLIATPPTQFGDFGLERTKHLASLVGNPQDTYPVIHIAGTSGKWSTATCTSQILQAHGYKTGLHVSPHLLDRRERVQVDGVFISDDILVAAAAKLFPAIEQCRNSQYGQPSYYEAMIVFAYLCFSLAHVDVAVIEVGCGWLYDGSNIVTRQDKISVITRQGYDHQDIVGETLEEIAYNDVGIILRWSRVVALQQDNKICNKVIKKWVQEKEATMSLLLSSWVEWNGTKDLGNHKDSSLPDTIGTGRSEWQIYGNIRLEHSQTIFDYKDQKDIQLWLVGLFQAENAALALGATQLFCRDFDREKARQWLEQVRFVWRCDIRTIGDRTVVLDGAHNPQKMQALVDTLRVLYPNKKIIRYTAFKQGKDRQDMLDIMQVLSQEFVLWSFAWAQDMSFENVSQEDIRNYLSWISIQAIIDPQYFFATIESTIFSDAIVVVTGSLYWLSTVYKKLS
jgi:dihydrofolate synthase / folylpolyglutamate synthase